MKHTILLIIVCNISSILFSQVKIKYGENQYSIYNKENKIAYNTNSNIYPGEYCFQFLDIINDTIFLTNEYYLKDSSKNYVTEYKIKLENSPKHTNLILKDTINNLYILKISTNDFSTKHPYTIYNLIGPCSNGFVYELTIVFQTNQLASDFKNNLFKKY